MLVLDLVLGLVQNVKQMVQKKTNPTKKEGEQMTQQITTVQETFITCNPGGFYHQAVMRNGWCKADTWLVVGFKVWNNWYNETRFASKQDKVKLPYPAATADTYEIALKMATELNAGIA